jgi:hypothetical protein
LNEGELRLKLDSIIEESNGAILPPIKFVYNIEHPLPSRTEANGRDFWGYYNGEVIDPLPKVDGLIRNRGDVQCFPPGSYSEWFDASSVFVGSTKQPVLSYCKSATLERILYPTGGYVQYNFELHECESKELFDNTIEHKNRVVSGSELETPFSIEYSKVAKNDLTRMAHADLGQLDVKNIHIPDRSRLLITVKDSLGQKIGEVLLKSHMPDQNANQYVIEPSSYSFSNLPESFTVLSSLVDPGSGITDLASPLFSLSWVSETERKKKNVGGLRVKSILRGNASDDIVSKTDFKYVNIDTTRSSGILRAVPSYGYFTITLSSINFPILCFARSSASVNESNISSGSPVGYERVMMIEGGGDGPDQVSEFIFSTYKDYPDLFHSSTYGVPSSYVGLESPHLPNMDNEWRRGRLLKRKLFLTKPGGILNLLSEETNTYQDFSSSGVFEDSISPSSKAILIGRALAHAGNRYSYNVYPVYLGNYGFLSKKVVKLFAKEGADSISTTIKHFYNKQLGIMRIEEESSNSNLHVKSFVYPSDMLNHDPFGIYQKMVENHLLSSKIISMSYLNGNAFKEKEMITYSLFNSGDQILPAKIEKYDAQGNIINSVEYQKYDERGNLLQEKTSDGLITSYLWGYGGRYLIARLTGVDYNAFSSVLNTTVLAKDLPSDNELFSQFSSLRSWLSNKLCKVETYTHQPLVGVSSISSSSDRIEFYQYDSFGRLRFILDRKKNILKQFCYNYQGQPDNCQLYYNVTLQQPFQKNDCPSGFTGSPYTYTVAAGTHAVTSQLEANNKAQQDLSSHGQNQANIHGTCLPVYYNVAIAEYFYNANCPNSTLDGVWVVIPAGAYSSTVGQAEADQLARAAAQQYANQNGTCSQSGFPLYGSNNTGSSMTLLLRNTQTQTSYYFFLGAYQGWSQLGTVPPGNYDIELISDGYNSFNYSIGCGFWGSAAGYASLYNVYLDGSCANIEITF